MQLVKSNGTISCENDELNSTAINQSHNINKDSHQSMVFVLTTQLINDNV